MPGTVLPGTTLAHWLERVRSDPEGIDRTRQSIATLLGDASVAEQVRARLAARAAGDLPAEPERAEGVALRLSGFLREGDGALHLDLRLGGVRPRLAQLRRWVFAGASEALTALTRP